MQTLDLEMNDISFVYQTETEKMITSKDFPQFRAQQLAPRNRAQSTHNKKRSTSILPPGLCSN